MIDVAEQLEYDPATEAKDLDRALLGGVRLANFISDEEILRENPKFYTDVIPPEYSSAILRCFFDIFNSQFRIVPNTMITVMHTEEGFLRMDVRCDSCIITFKIDTRDNSGTVNHREAYQESKEVSTWEEYQHKEIFLLGKAVFDNYFWGDC